MLNTGAAMAGRRCVRYRAERACRYRRGLPALTLLETLIALSVMTALIAASAPSIAAWSRNSEVRSSASTLLAALHAARSEAVTRNQPIRLRLGDPQGRAVWSFGCVFVTAACPARLRGAAGGTTAARWGAGFMNAPRLLDVAIAPGTGLPADVTFDATGAAPAVASGTDVARIDITHASADSARRLVVQLGTRGMARVCDPALDAARAMGCR